LCFRIIFLALYSFFFSIHRCCYPYWSIDFPQYLSFHY
jgi:hypothetical protein